MSKVPATVSSVLFSALVGPESVAPIAPAIPINLPINFSQAKNIKIFSGTYTPKNDYLYLQNQFSNDDAPNWMIVICDCQLNLTLSGTFINNVAFQRFSFISWVNPEGVLPQGIYLEGRTTMMQDEPCDYMVIIGQGDIS